MTTAQLPSRTIKLSRALRTLFMVNGIGNVVGGALLLPLAGILDAASGLSPTQLVAICVFYLVYGAAMWFAARRPCPRSGALVALIAVNHVWALACVLIVGTVLARPTTLGSALFASEAAIVTGLAAMQWMAYRSSRTPDGAVPTRPSAGGCAADDTSSSSCTIRQSGWSGT